MGITFIVTGISFGICHHKCGVDIGGSSRALLGFLFLLGIVLTGLSGTIVSKVSGTAKSWATFILVTGILFFVTIGALFVYANKEHLPALPKMGFNYY
jgi:hypothetical protein